MNNADMPAAPNRIESIPNELYKSVPLHWPHGLTKREHFAGLAMQALLAKYGNENADDCASYAVEYANALLKALEQDDEPIS